MKRLHLACTLVFMVFGQLTYGSSDLYWGDEIASAIGKRTVFYQKIGLVLKDTDFLEVTKGSQGAMLLSAVQATEDVHNPWYHFLSGAILINSSPVDARDHFGEALALSSRSPGLLCVLWFEFRRCKQDSWEEQCLTRLAHLMDVSLASAAPVVAQQVLAAAREEKTAGNRERALDLLTWSARFAANPFWQEFLVGWWQLPWRPFALISSIFGSIALMLSSWPVQTAAFFHAYSWLRIAGIAFILAVYVIVLYSALPDVLHRLTDTLPLGVDGRLKHALVILVYVSLLSFGLLPFLLVSGVVVWPYLQRRLRVPLGVALILLALAPIDWRLRDATFTLRSRETSLDLFIRARTEGYSRALQRKVVDHLETSPDDYLGYLAAALVALKRGDLESARVRIGSALDRKGNDPVVLITAGDIEWASGNGTQASHYYAQCAQRYPTYSKQSIGKTLRAGLLKLNAPDSLANSKWEGAVAPTFPSTSEELPFPDYRPVYFWVHVAPGHTGSWTNAALLWGATFLGMPIVLYLISAPLFLLVLYFVDRYSLSRAQRTRSIFRCRLCGVPICGNCHAENVCFACTKTTLLVTNEAVRTNIENQIASHRRRRNVIVRASLNVLFPGAGDMLDSDIPASGAALTMVGSACAFATYFALLTFSFRQPFWVARGLLLTISMAAAVYHVVNAYQPARYIVGLAFAKE